MVGRRTRASATTNKGKSIASALTNESKNDLLPNKHLVEDEYYASPKMKHCRSEKNLTFSCNTAGQRECKNLSRKHKTLKSTGKNSNNGERIGSSRFHTHTMDNFFKVCGAVKKQQLAGKKIAVDSKLYPTLSASLSPSPQTLNWHDMKLPSDCLYELSNDTNDSEETDLTDELPSSVLMNHSNGFTLANALNFTNIAGDACHAFSPNNSSITKNSSDNIFLQEPVLTLNVDKSPNQASSIKINKSLEVEPKFASRSSCTAAAAVLQGCFNHMSVSLKSRYSATAEEEEEEALFSLAKQKDVGDQGYALIMLPENDNSSCDSGVVFISSSSSSTVESSNQNSPPPPLEHKPTTPHRIVWPSPKREESPDNTTTTALSPRKSQRHNFTAATTTITSSTSTKAHNIAAVATNSKTRRRLNPEKEQAPYLTTTNHVNANNQAVNENVKNSENETQSPDDHDHEFKANATKLKSTKKQNKNITTRTKYIVSKTKNNNNTTTTAPNGNRCINEFFPVRRSERKTKTAVKEEMMRNLEQAILEERCDGLKVDYFEGKGRGVVAERHFQRGEFVIEYIGDLISIAEATEREGRYAMDENAGCYMYYFEHKNQQYCIDATEDTGKLGRLVNHSRYGNLITKVVVVKQTPHLVLIAKKDIVPGEELCYDYGDRSKDSLRNHPWLAL